MRTSRTTASLALAASLALGLTACQGDDAPDTITDYAPPTTTSSGPAPSGPSSTSGPSTTPGSSTATPSSAGTGATTPPADNPGPPATGGASPEAPVKHGELAPDTTVNATLGNLGPGPATRVTVERLGAYSSGSSSTTNLYAVLRATSTERGTVTVQFVLRDARGDVVAIQDEQVPVGGLTDEIKVLASSKTLSGAETSATRVSLRIKDNQPDDYATVAEVDPSFSFGQTDTGTPKVSGRYRTVGKGSANLLSVVCSDASGRTLTDSGVGEEKDAPGWSTFELSLDDAPTGFRPTRCWVGH